MRDMHTCTTWVPQCCTDRVAHSVQRSSKGFSDEMKALKIADENFLRTDRSYVVPEHRSHLIHWYDVRHIVDIGVSAIITDRR